MRFLSEIFLNLNYEERGLIQKHVPIEILYTILKRNFELEGKATVADVSYAEL